MKKYTIKATDKEGFFPTPYTNKFFAHSDAEALQQAREYYAFYFNCASTEVQAEIIHAEPASEILDAGHDKSRNRHQHRQDAIKIHSTTLN